MSPSATPKSPPSLSTISENGENHLRTFFVLHSALPRKPEQKSPAPGKTRRKVDLSPASPKPSEKPEPDLSNEEDDRLYEQLRIEAFDLVWSKIETAIKGILRQINISFFNEIHHWVCESFDTIRSSTTHGFPGMKQPYHLATDYICKQIFTALIFTKNIEFVDDLLTFEELGVHLKAQGCHVANLSSIDFSVKNGIGGCLRSLLRQLVAVTPDAADISILAAWYGERENCDNPMVIIIDDMERCSGTILAEFIMLLSEWTIKIPIILITGVATTIDAPTKLLPSNALQCLQPCKFMLSSPTERMDAIIRDILVKPCCGFGVGHEVAIFLRNYFLKHDGTVTSFIRALKIACIKHFSMEPLSFLGQGEIGDNSQVFWKKKCEMLPEVMLKHAFGLPSCQREEFNEMTVDSLACGLSELRRLQRNWSSVVMCLYEVGKFHKMHLLDIFCEAINPALCNSRASDYFLGGRKDLMPSSVDQGCHDGECSGLTKGSFIFQVARKVRDLPMGSLPQLFKIWAKHTEEMAEINHKVKELQSAMRYEEDGKSLKHKGLDSRERSTSRCRLNVEKGTPSVKERAAMLIECMVRDYLKPMEVTPFHEIVCFKHVAILQSALIGDPRRTIQVDLLKSYTYLQCSCCSKGGSVLLPSTHDTSIMYNLAQEHGDLINLHDWYQSFKATVSSNPKSKQKMQQSPMSKKRKATSVPMELDEASIQGRFCRAVTELQITGLLRMPSKRRPDYVQRVAFGL
ncbi:origin of replication complex subunit 3 [Magnolia sinica]|uniref:origin of replication complex subunit 3 n=1 Tax=Magnolia sinica TaxID=86752 RepID=UPI00265A0018|nr:origin of replication complex subunit 3 [Magnolia sinica]